MANSRLGFLPKEYEAKMEARKKEQARELEEAAALLIRTKSPTYSNESYSPSRSEEEAYSYAVERAGYDATNKLSHSIAIPERREDKMRPEDDTCPILFLRERPHLQTRKGLKRKARNKEEKLSLLPWRGEIPPLTR